MFEIPQPRRNTTQSPVTSSGTRPPSSENDLTAVQLNQSKRQTSGKPAAVSLVTIRGEHRERYWHIPLSQNWTASQLVHEFDIRVADWTRLNTISRVQLGCLPGPAAIRTQNRGTHRHFFRGGIHKIRVHSGHTRCLLQLEPSPAPVFRRTGDRRNQFGSSNRQATQLAVSPLLAGDRSLANQSQYARRYA